MQMTLAGRVVHLANIVMAKLEASGALGAAVEAEVGGYSQVSSKVEVSHKGIIDMVVDYL